MNLPERIKVLEVCVGAAPSGRLVREAHFVYTYSRDDPQQLAVGLLMPPEHLEYRDTSLFPVMDQNLPEGYLYERLRNAFPKQPLSPMHLLALIGANGIGRLSFRLPDTELAKPATPISKQEILSSNTEGKLFEELVRSYLSTGIGVAGVQPKILVPDTRATFPVPNLIVKSASDAYPGLAANEFLCLRAASFAGLCVPGFELSENGKLLVLDRFDLKADGTRIGFEDIAALMGKHVRDLMEDRKYHGSYEGVAEALKLVNVPRSDLAEFFAQLAFSVMVGNGDAHLKNFGVLYESGTDVRLAPMFDVVTSIYVNRTLAGGTHADTTMALKLFKGRKGTRKHDYPTLEDLLKFGSSVCGVRRPHEVLERIAEGMQRALREAQADTRIPADLLERMTEHWQQGLKYDQSAARRQPPQQQRG